MVHANQDDDMTDKNPIEYLEEARSAMVERRRFLVKDKVEWWSNANIGEGQKLPFTEIVDLQACIDALDRALTDEQKLQPVDFKGMVG
jgi:hypothetical protein